MMVIECCESWEVGDELFDEICPREVVNGVILECCSSCTTRFSS